MKIVEFDSYIQAMDTLCDTLSQVKEDLDTEHIVIVPDVYTFDMEKRLYTAGKGSFSIIVRSFSRLYSDYCSASNLLSQSGAVLMLKKIAYENRENLKCFKYSCNKSGFGKKIYATISRLREQNILPEDMKVESAKKNKIEDIKLIYSEYLKQTEGKFVDSAGKNAILAQYFNSLTSKQKKHYYLLNFDVLSKSAQILIDAIDKKCASFTVYKSKYAPIKSNIKTLSVYKAKNDADQLKESARLIYSDMQNGLSAEDICVVSESVNFDRATRIFADFSVPVFVDKKVSLNTHPLTTFVLGAYKVVRKGWKREDVLAFCKNPYFSVDKQEKDDFCTYVNNYCVNYKGFESEFDKELVCKDNAEKVRKILLEVLNEVIGTTNSVFSFANSVRNLIKRASEVVVDNLVIDTQRAIKETESVLKVMESVMKNQSWDLDFIIACYEESCSASSFSTVPQSKNLVKVGGLNDFRGQKFKKIYLLSFNEGVMPKREDDCELLTDSDIAEMEDFGLEFEGKIEVLNRRYKDELWQVLQNESDLFASYVSTEKDKPSYDLRILMETKKYSEYNRQNYLDELANCKDDEKFATLLAGEENAIEQIFTLNPSPKLSAVYEVVKNRISKYGKKAQGVIDKKFLKLTKTSVSALQTYATCPYKYFCSYVLGLKVLEDGTVKPVDVGNILHATVAEYLVEQEKDPIDEKVGAIVDKHIQENQKASLDFNARFCDRLKQEAIRLCEIARKQIEKDKFTLVGNEMSFGRGENSLKTIMLDFNGEKIPLVGAIDRVDEWGDYARVIDYKTGYVKEFSFSELYYGEKIQLPIYAKVMEVNGKKTCGFFYFPFSVKWDEKEGKNKLVGVFKNDNDEYSKEKVAEEKKENRKPLTSEQLEKVCNYAERIAQKTVDNIANGNLSVSPVKSGMYNSCDMCDFYGLCGYDKTKNKMREHIFSDSECREFMLKEGGGN